MSETNKEDTDWLISTLEGLCKQLENSESKSGAQIDAELQAATATVTTAIERCVQPGDQQFWKTELERVTTDSVESKPRTEGQREVEGEAPPSNACCPNCGKPFQDLGGHEVQIKCIHGCDAVYCSASCRRSHIRDHKAVCDALRRTAVLKQLGLSQRDELF